MQMARARKTRRRWIVDMVVSPDGDVQLAGTPGAWRNRSPNGGSEQGVVSKRLTQGTFHPVCSASHRVNFPFGLRWMPASLLIRAVRRFLHPAQVIHGLGAPDAAIIMRRPERPICSPAPPSTRLPKEHARHERDRRRRE